MKRIIIIGATSGIGREVAILFHRQGWKVGIAGRRIEYLEELKATDPEKFETQQMDVNSIDGPSGLLRLIDKLGGMDLFLLCSGIGKQNPALDPGIELATIETNVMGFTRMTLAAYHYFEKQEKGHIAVVSSIAGTKGLGAAPSYSASKRYQNIYIDALAQSSGINNKPIIFTDIRPGFVDTALLKDGKYPMLMPPDRVARAIVKGLLRKKRRMIIDWRYRIIVFFWRMIPEWLWERLSITSK